MEQTGTATKDGVRSKVDYLMEISHMNDIASVEKPEVPDGTDNTGNTVSKKDETSSDKSSDGNRAQ